MVYREHGHTNAKFFLAAIVVAFSFLCERCRTEAAPGSGDYGQGSIPLKQWINGDTVQVFTKHGVTTFNGQTAQGIIFYPGANGDTLSRIPFAGGKENGEAKYWYDKGHVKEIRIYSNGKKTGTHYGWYPDGKKKFEYNYTNDEFNGAYKEWYASGKLFRDQHFNMGHEEGMQTTYFEGGEIKSNYLIKNQRRYGLPGTQNCVNVADSIPR